MKDTDCIDCKWSSSVVTARNDSNFYRADCHNPDAIQEVKNSALAFKKANRSLVVNRKKMSSDGYIPCKYWALK